jgi:hypothetical protein
MVQTARRELERSRLDRSLERFLSKVQEHHSRVPSRPHLPAVVCTVVLLDQREEARAACIAAREANATGGFTVGPRTFVDLALDWLDNTAPTRH